MGAHDAVGMEPTDNSSQPTTHTSVPFALVLTALSGAVDCYAIMTHRVMTNAQTGNVIMMAQAVALKNWGQVSTHLWSLCAFLLGAWIANFVPRRSRPTALNSRPLSPAAHPLVWLLSIFTALLLLEGLVPTTAPVWLSVAPLAVMGGMLFAMFRNVAGLSYVPVTTTGNLVRIMTDLHGALYQSGTDRDKARHALAVHGGIVAVFIAGAVLGGIVTTFFDVRGIWVAAAGMAALVVLLVAGAPEPSQEPRRNGGR